jgi:hypothetical protein
VEAGVNLRSKHDFIMTPEVKEKKIAELVPPSD